MPFASTVTCVVSVRTEAETRHSAVSNDFRLGCGAIGWCLILSSGCANTILRFTLTQPKQVSMVLIFTACTHRSRQSLAIYTRSIQQRRSAPLIVIPALSIYPKTLRHTA